MRIARKATYFMSERRFARCSRSLIRKASWLARNFISRRSGHLLEPQPPPVRPGIRPASRTRGPGLTGSGGPHNVAHRVLFAARTVAKPPANQRIGMPADALRALRTCLACLAVVLTVADAHAETGYDLWLRYVPVADAALRAEYRRHASQIVAGPSA